MKKLFLTLTAIAAGLNGFACTNFLVGKNASTDGSTLVTYSADSYMLFGALYHYPAATYAKDTKLAVHEWDTGKYLGEIDQVQQTYNVIGNMNEHQLTITETTFGGREELVDTTGIIDYGSLIYITLQRAKTAKEAIKTMTDLVEKYGYCSSGESFSIADPNEIWIMEMIGKGPNRKGAVWVAQRIPDDCVAAHANQARITTINFKDKANCLYAKDVISFAKEKGYFKGKDAEFSFSDTYAPLDYGALRFCEARVWSFFRQVAPETDRFVTYIKGETKERMPLWVKPVKKVSAEDLMNYMRDHYEGTELDLTTSEGAGPFASPFRLSPLTYKVDGVEYFQERPVATQQTGFSYVAQMRSWLPDAIGGVVWFGVDDATMNLYVPMYSNITRVPLCYDQNNGSLLDFSWTSAFWIYNWVANMAYYRYSDMIGDICTVQSEWETKFLNELPNIDKQALELYAKNPSEAVAFLTEYSNRQAEESTMAWKKLGEKLMVKFLDGIRKVEENGEFLKNDKHIPPRVVRPGYPSEFSKKVFIEPNPDKYRVKTQEELDNRK